ncbi:hypothetical protein Bca101_051181 [Brassica carinata]
MSLDLYFTVFVARQQVAATRFEATVRRRQNADKKDLPQGIALSSSRQTCWCFCRTKILDTTDIQNSSGEMRGVRQRKMNLDDAELYLFI